MIIAIRARHITVHCITLHYIALHRITLIYITVHYIAIPFIGRTPGLHNKIPAHKIFARVWVAQKSFLFIKMMPNAACIRHSSYARKPRGTNQGAGHINILFMMRFTMCLMFVCRASPCTECEHDNTCVLTKAAPDVNHRVSDENATCQTVSIASLAIV